MSVFDIHDACNPVLLTPGNELSPELLNPTNYNLLSTGSASVLTGASGHVMLQVPKFQYAYTFSGNTHRFRISFLPFPGSQIFPAFIKSGVVVPYRYIGIYPASWYDVSVGAYVDGDGVLAAWDNSVDRIGSVAGKKPASNLTRSKFRGAAVRVGAGWSITDFWCYALLKILYVTKYNNLNSQAVLGSGNTRFSSWSFSTEISATGKVLSIAAPGQSTSGGSASDYVNFMGIEDLYGGLNEWIDGWNIHSGSNYVCSTPASYADDTFAGYALYGEINPTASGWQDTLQPNIAMLPSGVGATSITRLTDMYLYSSGWVAPTMGGIAASGVNTGLFYLTALYPSSSPADHTGARLCF